MEFWYLKDDMAERFRVGRTDWPGDRFEMLTENELISLKATCKQFAITIKEIKNDD